MKKTEKLSILISIVLISLLAISAVSAAEADDAIGAVSTDDAPAVADTQDKAIAEESDSPEPIKETETQKVASEPEEPGTFADLDTDVNGPRYTGEQRDETRINLTRDYVYNPETDTQYTSGVSVKPSPEGGNTLIINGNGHTISAENGNPDFLGEGAEGIFVLDNGIKLVLENLILVQAKSAVTVNNATSSLIANNVTFKNNRLAINNELGGSLIVAKSTFTDNIDSIISVGDLAIPDQKPDTKPDEEEFLSLFDVIITDSIFESYNYELFTEGDFGLKVNNTAVLISNSTFKGFSDGIGTPNAAILAMNSLLRINDNTTFAYNWDSIVMNNTGLIMDGVKFLDGGVSIIANNTPILVINNTLFEDNFIAMNINNTLVAFINNTAFIGVVEDEEPFPEGEAAIFANNTLLLNMYHVAFINNTGAIFAQNSIIFANKTEFINNSDEWDDEEDHFVAAFIVNDGALSIVDSFFANNTGAIDINNGVLDITHSAFINNTHNAIWAFNSDVNITDAFFKGNTAGQYGGAIYFGNGNLTIENGTFISNSAQNGGAIYIESAGNATISGDFINNTLVGGSQNERRGGAIYFESGNATIIGRFINNSGARAGAIYNNGNAEIYGIFENNTATYAAGGAIFNDNLGNATIIAEFTNNKATRTGANGGAIYNFGGYVTIIDSAFIGNTAAQDGGAISANTKENIYFPTTEIYGDIDDILFSNNIAGRDGGAIHNTGSMSIEFAEFTDNNAARNGGAIYNGNTGVMDIEDAEFTENEATQDGGAIYNIGSMNITRAKFTDNRATSDGGAIYNGATTYEYAMEIFDSFFTNDFAEELGSEIYTIHQEVDPTEHSRLIHLVGSTITNNLEDNPTNFLVCGGCIIQEYNEIFTSIVAYNATILNNVTDKVVLFFTLNEADIEETPYFNVPITVTIDGDDENPRIVYAFEPLILDNLTVGPHTIEVEYEVLGAEAGYDFFEINVTESVKTLEEQLAEAQAKVENLTKELNDTIKELNDTKDALIANETALNNAIKELNDTNKKVENLTNQLNAAQKQVEDLTGQLNAANNELTTTKAALNDANNKVNTLTTQNAQLNKDLQNANNKVNDANAKIKKVKAAKKVKKSKTYKITVTLSKKTKQYVYLFFDKTYRKKTNSKGTVTFKISKKTLKKLLGKKKSKKISYKVVYNQNMKSMKVTIKK